MASYLNEVQTKDLHDKGYDLSDIYYYLYEYIKTKPPLFPCISILCDYINQHYNGHYNGILILIFVEWLFEE